MNGMEVAEAESNSELAHIVQTGDNIILVEIQTTEPEPVDPVAVYAVLGTLLVGQVALFCWKRLHKRSFELVTLIGMWIIPCLVSYKLHYWRFLVVWSVFSGVTGYVLSLCLSKNLSSLTPRRVYTWFFIVYRISVFVGVCGYATLLLEFFGLAPVFMLLGVEEVPLVLLWYGLYFGILGRDCAEVASDWMQSGVMGGRRQLDVQIHKCAICKKELQDAPGVVEQEQNVEMTIQLDCKHLFHEFCIRGWTLIGKKDICPTCGEKVNLKTLYANRPWETSNLSWIKMLDVLRYFIVWNPLILLSLQCILYLAGFLAHANDSTNTT